MSVKPIKESFLKNLTVLTGAPTAGKSLISPIVASFANTENFRMSILLEHLGTLHKLGKLDTQTLVFLWRYTVDFMAYDNLIGRDMNLRFADETSIFAKQQEDVGEFLDRLLADRGEFKLTQLDTYKPLVLLTLTDAFCHAQEWFLAFPFVRFVWLRRHPIDLVYSWYNHRYGQTARPVKNVDRPSMTFGSETYSSQLNQVLLIDAHPFPVPHYASEVSDEYEQLSEMDRVIYMIDQLTAQMSASRKKLSEPQRTSVLEIEFDDLVHESEAIVEQLAEFLNTTTTELTFQVLAKEKCPRPRDDVRRNQKLSIIKAESSSGAFKRLEALVEKY